MIVWERGPGRWLDRFVPTETETETDAEKKSGPGR
jgi:hypothetical protein